jgi:hypothetical protein
VSEHRTIPKANFDFSSFPLLPSVQIPLFGSELMSKPERIEPHARKPGICRLTADRPQG